MFRQNLGSTVSASYLLLCYHILVEFIIKKNNVCRYGIYSIITMQAQKHAVQKTTESQVTIGILYI